MQADQGPVTFNIILTAVIGLPNIFFQAYIVRCFHKILFVLRNRAIKANVYDVLDSMSNS